MNFKQRQNLSSTPQVNLVPMLDVLMSVLTFFIITSMMLTGERLSNIELPGAGGGVQQEAIDPLEIGLNQQGEIVIANRTVSEEELAETMQAYLAKNPQGQVILKADRELPYEQILQLLKKMGAIGGRRVSLAIQKQ